MRLGLFGINLHGAAVDPAVAVAVAVAAEDAGWESVWTGEHFVVPDPPLPGSVLDADLAVLDPFVTLGLVAGATRTLRLGTGVTVVPVHSPALLAKHVASVDRISGGRFLFGVGVGYLEPEFRALGVPLAGRGATTDAALDVLATLWADGATRLNGAAVRAEPGPVRPGGPPLHVGGESPAAMRRAMRRGDGWYGWQLSPDAAAAAVKALATLGHERPATKDPLEISVTPDAGRRLDPATVAAYAAAGVDRLIVVPPPSTWWDADALIGFVERTAARLLQAGDVAAIPDGHAMAPGSISATAMPVDPVGIWATTRPEGSTTQVGPSPIRPASLRSSLPAPREGSGCGGT